MPGDKGDCVADDFERPSKTLVLLIFTLAVFMKLGIILVEIMV
ncbi:uncharacterized protein LOC128254251 [Drosophila gunungcola]|uniref:Uncharacterized protein n=1 Tax=Drosophila gunungcola TaxID=103775 RepID=A0A9P9YMM4_9MUSC|nr:uncharacterized protein LOC128254251 [Drosophila gunungcola]KAI8039820.1 hypothetical protein M5D96_007244 [Drosophila gunungcola]